MDLLPVVRIHPFDLYHKLDQLTVKELLHLRLQGREGGLVLDGVEYKEDTSLTPVHPAPLRIMKTD